MVSTLRRSRRYRSLRLAPAADRRHRLSATARRLTHKADAYVAAKKRARWGGLLAADPVDEVDGVVAVDGDLEWEADYISPPRFRAVQLMRRPVMAVGRIST